MDSIPETIVKLLAERRTEELLRVLNSRERERERVVLTPKPGKNPTLSSAY
jgi:hypothetical protein